MFIKMYFLCNLLWSETVIFEQCLTVQLVGICKLTSILSIINITAFIHNSFTGNVSNFINIAEQ